jgi:small neutral amino acid transporter SnatA (MarC family)
LKVLIKPIPSMPKTIAMPVVLSPKMLPCTIRRASVKHRAIPKANNAGCRVLMCLFVFYTSLFISNFILEIFNSMLELYNI